MRYKLHALSVLIAVLECSTIWAQSGIATKNNSLSFEIGKNGLIYNLCYDKTLKNKNLGFRLFAGANFAHWFNAKTAGAGAYFIPGSKKDKFELGIDISYLRIDETSGDQKSFTILAPKEPTNTYYGSLNLGYRHYSRNTIFRIGLSPGFIPTKLLPGAYASFGFLFWLIITLIFLSQIILAEYVIFSSSASIY